MKKFLARYEGATWSPSRSWIPAAVQSARFDAGSATRLELVRKSRYFEKNNAIANRMADLFECYTIGAGLQLNPASSDPKWNANAKIAWEGWTALCDLTSRQGFGTLMGLAVRTWFIDGECFILLTRGESGRPRIQLLESHLVATPPALADQEGDSIIDGIQVDRNGRPTAYWVAHEDRRGNRSYRSVPAEFVIHLFEPSRPGQYRGLPFPYPVINDLHDLDDLQMLENKAARDAAEVSNIIKNSIGEIDDEELIRRVRAVTNQDAQGQTTTENRAEAVRETIGGRTVSLQPGEELIQFKSDRPSVATKEYWRFLAEKVCAGVGIPYVIVFPDSMQGTVYRGALDMANAWFRTRFLVPAGVAARIYEYVMDFERVNNPVLRDPPGDWRNVIVHPPRAVNVDVGRNSVAMLRELESGTRTYAFTYAEVGMDWRQMLEQKAIEAAFIRELAARYKVDISEISTLQEERAQRIDEPEPAPNPTAADEGQGDLEPDDPVPAPATQ